MRTRVRKNLNEQSRANGNAQISTTLAQRAGIAPAEGRAAQLLSMSDLANRGSGAAHVAQMRETLSSRNAMTAQREPNRTGLPDDLKSGLESLSGFNLNGVNVHYNSPEPAKVGAHAVTQGMAIHVAPGQQEHINHEGWHVVQQLQNRVKPTTQVAGVQVNDNSSLEREADRMGARAKQTGASTQAGALTQTGALQARAAGNGLRSGGVSQRQPWKEFLYSMFKTGPKSKFIKPNQKYLPLTPVNKQVVPTKSKDLAKTSVKKKVNYLGMFNQLNQQKNLGFNKQYGFFQSIFLPIMFANYAKGFGNKKSGFGMLNTMYAPFSTFKSLPQLPGNKPKRISHSPGTHGYKKREQRRLSEQFGIKVSGSTHESEHPIGVEPLIRTSGSKRGDDSRVKALENKAPAYQEDEAAHGRHIGTGNKGTDETGFSSSSYRDTQRALLEAGDVSSAVQINQLGYAFDPEFRKEVSTEEGKAATNSYDEMVNNMKSFEYAKDSSDVGVSVDYVQQAEMNLARRAAETGKWPTQDEIDKTLEFFKKRRGTK